MSSFSWPPFSKCALTGEIANDVTSTGCHRKVHIQVVKKFMYTETSEKIFCGHVPIYTLGRRSKKGFRPQRSFFMFCYCCFRLPLIYLFPTIGNQNIGFSPTSKQVGTVNLQHSFSRCFEQFDVQCFLCCFLASGWTVWDFEETLNRLDAAAAICNKNKNILHNLWFLDMYNSWVFENCSYWKQNRIDCGPKLGFFILQSGNGVRGSWWRWVGRRFVPNACLEFYFLAAITASQNSANVTRPSPSGSRFCSFKNVWKTRNAKTTVIKAGWG